MTEHVHAYKEEEASKWNAIDSDLHIVSVEKFFVTFDGGCCGRHCCRTLKENIDIFLAFRFRLNIW